MANINNLIKELKRRRVFKSAGLYAFSAFIIMQVASMLTPTLMLPELTNRLVLILLLLSFPIAMIFAWIYDRSPEGLIKTKPIDFEKDSIDKDGIPKDKNGDTAIVFIDIVNYTNLMNQDEKKAIDLVHYKHKVILPFIQKYGGALIKRDGSGTLCAFSESAKAVCFSLDVLQMWKGISPTKLKVGVHMDKITFDQGEALGKGINLTYKISALASSDNIYLSKSVSDTVQQRPDIHTTSIGDKTPDGFTESYELFSVNIPEKFVPMDADVTKSSAQNINENKTNVGAILGWVGGIQIAIFLLFQGVQYFGNSTNSETNNSIAVFPFDNILKIDDFEWLSDGFARTLTFKLSELKNLNVIDQLQIIKAIEKVQPKKAGISSYDAIARKTAEKMNINLLLSGSYQIYGEQIQIIAQLVDVESGVTKPLIMESYSLSDPIAMQSDIANKISTLLTNNNKSKD